MSDDEIQAALLREIDSAIDAAPKLAAAFRATGEALADATFMARLDTLCELERQRALLNRRSVPRGQDAPTTED